MSWPSPSRHTGRGARAARAGGRHASASAIRPTRRGERAAYAILRFPRSATHASQSSPTHSARCASGANPAVGGLPAVADAACNLLYTWKQRAVDHENRTLACPRTSWRSQCASSRRSACCSHRDPGVACGETRTLETAAAIGHPGRPGRARGRPRGPSGEAGQARTGSSPRGAAAGTHPRGAPRGSASGRPSGGRGRPSQQPTSSCDPNYAGACLEPGRARLRLRRRLATDRSTPVAWRSSAATSTTSTGTGRRGGVE